MESIIDGNLKGNYPLEDAYKVSLYIQLFMYIIYISFPMFCICFEGSINLFYSVLEDK